MGLRLSSNEAANLQFSRGDVVAFQPKGMPSTREWVQINHADSADYAQSLNNLALLFSDQEKWDEYKAKTESASDEIAEQLGELGI